MPKGFGGSQRRPFDGHLKGANIIITDFDNQPMVVLYREGVGNVTLKAISILLFRTVIK